jgi:hypothetical protein
MEEALNISLEDLWAVGYADVIVTSLVALLISRKHVRHCLSGKWPVLISTRAMIRA